jgi:hypothetical protein
MLRAGEYWRDELLRKTRAVGKLSVLLFKCLLLCYCKALDITASRLLGIISRRRIWRISLGEEVGRWSGG